MNQHFSHLSTLLVFAFISCSLASPPNEPSSIIGDPQDYNSYWKQGKAEISTYQLSQARYGELRTGTVVNVFVAEPWNEEKQVKSDGQGDFEVLKLNSTKKFITGVYPYSMMTSVYTGVEDAAAQKITCTSQEWCGHTFTQLNRESDNWIGKQFSYFESEGDEQFSLSESMRFEDEIWSIIRLNPEELPLGDLQMLPSSMYMRLSHLDFDVHTAKAILNKGTTTSVYSINYPSIQRTVEITFSNAYPHVIDQWKEVYTDGYGSNKRQLTTEARLLNREMIDYWNKNSNSDEYLRKELGLD